MKWYHYLLTLGISATSATLLIWANNHGKIPLIKPKAYKGG